MIFHPSWFSWEKGSYLLATSASATSWGKFRFWHPRAAYYFMLTISSDIWGRKPILLVAVSFFFIGSLLCAISSNSSMIIAGRAVQGAGGGGLLTLVSICISDLFSMRTRPKYFGNSTTFQCLRHRADHPDRGNWNSLGICKFYWTCDRRRFHSKGSLSVPYVEFS
jgi:MFS family permease